jgi:hypothetical protein
MRFPLAPQNVTCFLPSFVSMNNVQNCSRLSDLVTVFAPDYFLTLALGIILSANNGIDNNISN